MIYTMTTNYALWDGVNAGQVVFGSAGSIESQPILGTAGGLQTAFYFDGNATAFLKSWFPADTRIILEQVRFTIPQYRGVQYSILPATGLVNPFTINTVNAGGADDIYINLLNFNEWIDVNRLLETPTAGLSYNLQIERSQILYCDFRNVQAIYDGISPYLQVELKVNSPLEPRVLP